MRWRCERRQGPVEGASAEKHAETTAAKPSQPRHDVCAGSREQAASDICCTVRLAFARLAPVPQATQKRTWVSMYQSRYDLLDA